MSLLPTCSALASAIPSLWSEVLVSFLHGHESRRAGQAVTWEVKVWVLGVRLGENPMDSEMLEMLFNLLGLTVLMSNLSIIT